MSLRCRGAPAAGVIFVIVFLLTNYFQPICSIECESNCPPTSQAMQTQRGCSTGAIEDIRTTKGAQSARVRWTIPESACQVHYIIVRYTTYQKKACEPLSPPQSTPNARWVAKRVSTNSAYMDGLEPYTSYDIEIQPTYLDAVSGPWFQGRITTNPSAPPVVENVLVRSMSSSMLQFVWDPLTCTNTNGIFDHYSAVLTRQNSNEYVDRGTVDDINLSSVTFTALDLCTTYTVTVLAVNRNQLANSRQSTAVSAETKAKVKSAEVYPDGSGSLSVRWNIHKRCRRTELTYHLTYQLVQLEACPWAHGGASQIRIFSSSDSSNMFTIHALRPFATYRIWISIDGVRDGAYPDVLTGTTLPSDPRGVRDLSHTQIDDRILFSWGRPDCADLHGSFQCFNYRLMRDNTEEIVNQGDCTQVMQKTYMMDTLQACTVYTFQVQVVTRDYQQRKSYWETINAQTPTRAPGVPRNVRISQGSDTVTWEAPIDLPCEPEGYYVTHKLLYKDMCEIPSDATKEKRKVDVDSHLMRKTIQGLISYSQYEVCVLGTNAGGDGEPTCVNFTTGHEAPSKPPKRVECSDQSYDSLTFTWNKPRCGYRNGPISHYEYILYARGSNVSRRGRVNGSENGGDITFTNLIPVTIYVFRVRANNDDLSGSYGPALEARPSLPRGSSISIVVGSAVGAILVIVVVIVLIIIFYKRKSNESATSKSEGRESESSPQYENPVFDQSQTDAHTYQDLNTIDQTYQDLNTITHTYEDLNTITHTYQDLNTIPHTYQDCNTDVQNYDDTVDPHAYQEPEEVNDAKEKNYVNGTMIKQNKVILG